MRILTSNPQCFPRLVPPPSALSPASCQASCRCPLQGIFNDDAFAKMKKGARIVNVARGGVVDDASLARALDAGIVAQAALDVFSKEPPPPENPLIQRADVVCTPHLGASTTEAQEGVSLEIAEAVVGALKVRACLGSFLTKGTVAAEACAVHIVLSYGLVVSKLTPGQAWMSRI